MGITDARNPEGASAEASTLSGFSVRLRRAGDPTPSGAIGRSRWRAVRRPLSPSPGRVQALRPAVVKPLDDPEGSPFGLATFRVASGFPGAIRRAFRSVSRPSDSTCVGGFPPILALSPGFPFDVGGKVDHGPGWHKLRATLFFANSRSDFAGARGRGRLPVGRPRTRETPREPRPKPQPSRGSHAITPGKRAPSEVASKKPKLLRHRPGVALESARGKVGEPVGPSQGQPHVVFRVLRLFFAVGPDGPGICRGPFL